MYPQSLDNLPTNRATGGPAPAADNNAQATAINALEQRVGVITPGDSRSLEFRTQALEQAITAGSTPTPADYYGFEVDEMGWTLTGNGSRARDTAVKRTGLASLRVITGASGQSGASFGYSGLSGNNYVIRMWVVGDVTSAGKFVTGSLTDVNGGYTQVSLPVKLSTVWQEICVLVPATGTNLTLSVQGVDLTSGLKFWVDDISIGTAPTPLITTSGRAILKNGQPKRWRGMNHSNVPIGFDYTHAWWQEPKQIRFDIPDIAAGGWDAIKLYADAYDRQGYGAMLDECFRNGVDVFMLYYAPHLTDYSVSTGGANRTAAIAAYTAMVNHTLYHPAVVAYGFGNEVNYELGGTSEADWYSLVDAAAAAAKAIDPSRITYTSNGDVGSVQTFDSVVPNLDVWGANVYRGTGFAGLDITLQTYTKKPAIITEFGYDRYNHNQVTPGEDQVGQALRELSLTRELDGMRSVSARFHFEWADEWWKESTPNDVHNNAGTNVNYNDDRDQTYDEEWFGITEALNTGSAQSRVKKQAYTDIKAYQLATVTNSPVLPVEVVSEALGSPGGFIMRDSNYVSYQVQMTGRGVLQITPIFVLPAENLATPILQFNDTAYHLTSGKVDTWIDISPSRKNAINYNPANQPQLIAGALNGHGIFRFAGTGQFLDINNMVLGGNLTVFIVAANQRTSGLTNSIDTLISNVPSGGVVPGVALSTFNYYADAAQRKFSADYDAGIPTNLWVNGSNVSMNLAQGVFKVLTAQFTGVQAHNFAQIGLYTDGVLNGQNDMAEIIVYQGLLGTSARNAIEAALTTKYGIT